MNNNLEFENTDPSPDSVEDNYPRTNYGEGYYEEPKQETLEEAAERIRQESFTCCILSKSIDYVTVGEREKSAFIKGAKWQMERNYSEEEVKDMMFEILNTKREECCVTHTKDSIIRKVFEQFKKK
jgi:hypothetical protein